MSARSGTIHQEIDPQNFENSTLGSLKAYWAAKRAGRDMPSRLDIKPAELKEQLGWIVLLDVLPDLIDFRFRTIGTRVTEHVLADSTGKTLTEAFAPFGRQAIDSLLSSHRIVAREKVAVRLYGGADWLKRSFLDFDALLLPLSDDDTTTNMILGALTFKISRQLLDQSRNAP